MPRPPAYCATAAAFAALIAVTGPADAETGFWQTRSFPSPNGGMLVYRMLGNHRECTSSNGGDCVFNEVNPPMCSADHRAKRGITGDENPSTLLQSGQADQVRR